MHARFCALVLLASFVAVMVCNLVFAEDWPGWRGANRTGQSSEKGLLQKWPERGPKLLWKAKGLGGGYSTPAIVGGKLYVTGTKTKFDPPKGFGGFGGGGGKGASATECIYCLDLNGGKVLWSTEIGKTTGMFAGPRS